MLNDNNLGQEFTKTTDSLSIGISDLIDENHKAYVNFVSSLKSSITRKAYVIRLKNYLRSPLISFSTFDELLTRDIRLIEQGIIDILIDMRHKKQLSFSAQNIFLCSLTHFFSINDVTINRKKIKKFMSESENKYEYRSYTHAEIASLLNISDEREKTIILILASTGMRVGAVHPLRLKDLKKCNVNEQGGYIYQIQLHQNLNIIPFVRLNVQSR
jgi:integrase